MLPDGKNIAIGAERYYKQSKNTKCNSDLK